MSDVKKENENELEKYINRIIVVRKKIGSTKYGAVTEIEDTPLGKVLVAYYKTHKLYVPLEFIDQVNDSTIVLKKGLKPFFDRFWENLKERIPVIQNVPIGKIEEVRFEGDWPHLVIKPKVALPKVIETVWRKIRTSPKVKYYDYVKKELGLPPELALNPKVVGLLAKMNDIEIPENLFLKYFVTPLPPVTKIDDFYIHLEKYLEVIEYETEVVEDLSILPKPIKYQIPEGQTPEDIFERLKIEFKNNKIKTKFKGNRLQINPKSWLYVILAPSGSNIELSLEVDWRQYIQDMQPPIPWQVIALGIFGFVIWAKKVKRLQDKHMMGKTFIDDPLNFEDVKKIRDLVEKVVTTTS